MNKVLLIGMTGSGKTTLIQSFLEQKSFLKKHRQLPSQVCLLILPESFRKQTPLPGATDFISQL